MGRTYLVEGVSGSGKTSVCDELLRRGYDAVHGDRELAYQGDPVTGEPTATADHEHHLWDLDAVRAIVADDTRPLVLLCGGSRNHDRVLDLVDGVFVLHVDAATLRSRLAARPEDEFGGRPDEQAFVLRLHATGEDVPDGIAVDATRPVAEVVDAILAHLSR